VGVFNAWGAAIVKKLEKGQLARRNVVADLSSVVDAKIVSGVQDALTEAARHARGRSVSNRWNLLRRRTRSSFGSILDLGSAATTTDIAGPRRHNGSRHGSILRQTRNASGDLFSGTHAKRLHPNLGNPLGRAFFPPAGSLLIWPCHREPAIRPPPDTQVSSP